MFWDRGGEAPLYARRQTVVGLKRRLRHLRVLRALALACDAGLPPADVIASLELPLLTRDHQDPMRRKIAQKLLGGASVAEALRGENLPKFIQRTLEEAEKRGKLKEVLPLLGDMLQCEHGILAQGCPQGKTFFVTALLLVGLGTFIVPHMEKLFVELLGYPYGSLWFSFATLGEILFGILMMFLALTPFFRSHVLDGVFRWVPGVRTLVRRQEQFELTAMMHCLLAAGLDVSESAKILAVAAPRWYLKKPLRQFAETVSGGGDWLEAWGRVMPDPPFARLLLSGGYRADRVIEAFAALRNLLNGELQSLSLRWGTLLEVGMVLLNGAIVASVWFWMFAGFTRLIEAFAS